MREMIKKIFWNFPFVSRCDKEKVVFFIKNRMDPKRKIENDVIKLNEYRKQIINTPTAKSKDYKKLSKKSYTREKEDIKLFAFYLPQMYPTPENDAWWGKGTTEWNNVCRAMPQFIGHYQPRMPGELGFYDLRIKENMERQIELAELYGIYGFCFYYYWFDGKRLLDKPLDMFINNKKIQMPFCLCWCNESWTSAFVSGASNKIVMKQNNSEESYKQFIKDIIPYFEDDRYYTIMDKKVLLVYRVQEMPSPQKVIDYWRGYCKEKLGIELYIIGCWRAEEPYNAQENGFDACFEFQAASILQYCKNINDKINFSGDEFVGNVYSYKDLVDEKIYEKNFIKQKLYNAVMPMWDNTPRRNNHNVTLFHNSSPALYKRWLKDLIRFYKKRQDIDDNIAFINSWNEWGEGSYIEPDKYFGYAYLNATREAIEESRG